MLRTALFDYGRWLGNGDRAFREVAAARATPPDERVVAQGPFVCEPRP
jgi:hypothetical protein